MFRRHASGLYTLISPGGEAEGCLLWYSCEFGMAVCARELLRAFPTFPRKIRYNGRKWLTRAAFRGKESWGGWRMGSGIGILWSMSEWIIYPPFWLIKEVYYECSEAVWSYYPVPGILWPCYPVCYNAMISCSESVMRPRCSGMGNITTYTACLRFDVTQ